MKFLSLIFIAALVMLTGCTTLNNAGSSSFEASPFVNTKTGETICCVVKINSGKEYSTLTAHVSKTADGSIVVDIAESGTKAFQGQQIAADAGVANVGTAAKVATAIVLAPTAPAALAGAGAATLLTPTAKP